MLYKLNKRTKHSHNLTLIQKWVNTVSHWVWLRTKWISSKVHCSVAGTQTHASWILFEYINSHLTMTDCQRHISWIPSHPLQILVDPIHQNLPSPYTMQHKKMMNQTCNFKAMGGLSKVFSAPHSRSPRRLSPCGNPLDTTKPYSASQFFLHCKRKMVTPSATFWSHTMERELGGGH